RGWPPGRTVLPTCREINSFCETHGRSVEMWANLLAVSGSRLAWPAVTAQDRPSIDVVGIGNALVDVLSHESEEFIERHGLVKGSMTLIDTERAEELYAAMGEGLEVSGGSAA